MLELIQQADESVLRWIAEHIRMEAFDPAVVFYTHLGDKGLLFIAAAVLMLLFRRYRKGGAAALGGMLLGLLAVNVALKPMVARPRPHVVMEGFSLLLEAPDSYSFPSGHTNSAFAFAVAVCVALPKECKAVKLVSLAAAVLMGLSRLYTGVHFPTDVLGGALVGSLCGLIAGWVVKTLTGGVRTRRSSRR